MLELTAHDHEGYPSMASISRLLNYQHDVRAHHQGGSTLPVVVSKGLFHTASQPVFCSILSFLFPSSIELLEVLRRRASGRTDRVDIHDRLLSATPWPFTEGPNPRNFLESDLFEHLPLSEFLTHA